MANLPTSKMKRKLYYVVITVVMLAFIIVSTSIVNLTVVQHDFYLDKATKQQLSPRVIPANRGTIYDRNMGVVAQSATVWDVVLAPNVMVKYQAEYVAKTLSEILGKDPESTQKYYDKIIKAAGKTNSSYEIIERKVEKDVADNIRKKIVEGMENKDKGKVESLKGIDLIENTKRYYPNGTFASSLVGFTGTDSQGLYGVELSYDKELSGVPGYIVSAKDGMGGNMPTTFEEKFDPTNGNNIVLTIDQSIQHFLETALDELMKAHEPLKGCAGIVMNVNTGEILAMANLPTFNLNDPWTLPADIQTAINELPESEQNEQVSLARQKLWSNKAVSYAYQPGSTFKTVVASAALEERTVSLDSTFFCQGFVQVMDREMGCHVGRPGHGQLDLTGALVNSCNPAFVKIGADLGATAFYEYYKGFGFTEKTGIDLPGENIGSYLTDKEQGVVSLASCSFGQTESVTAIQLITGVSAVVNGGKLVTPHVVKDVLDQNGNIIRSTQTEVKRQVISAETSATLRQMMEAVVDVKGGTNASIMGYRIGGKSGTSQKQNPGDSKEARIASYIGVAPIDNPEIAVYIMVDESTSNDVYGSVIAAPGVASVLSNTLPYLGYSPQYTEDQKATLEVVMPNLNKLNVLEAEGKLGALGLGKPRIIGDGTFVVKQIPGIAEKMPKDGQVILYTESVAETLVDMPNVVGMSPTQAKAAMTKSKFNVRIKGLATDHATSRIIEQSIPEGRATPIGTVVELTCIKADTD